jgi:hypothetical protein
MEDWETPDGKVALAFATALVNGKFKEAHALLSTALAEDWSLSELKATYEELNNSVHTELHWDRTKETQFSKLPKSLCCYI